MATATCTFTPTPYNKGKDNTQRHEVTYGLIAIQASPATYVTNGLPLTSLGEVQSLDAFPMWGSINGLLGFVYAYDFTHGTVRIFQQNATTGGLVEITNGTAIPANVSGDAAIQARFEWARN